ncbi:DDE-type integrase/transposase/recombinase, partial [Streptomyces sp. NPDC056821]|uniref:DDE-type integrase/transposase/recombinase n=1 Tax=unclassified Streptomyces TaxID=2593676 RepID=UPI0036CBCD59
PSRNAASYDRRFPAMTLNFPFSHTSTLRGEGQHCSHKGLNSRAENSHQPTRQRERTMKGFRSVCGAQRFLSAFSGISPHLRPRRHLMTATEYRTEMSARFTIWDQITGCAALPTPA